MHGVLSGVGGIGLFLVGMLLLTDGLRGLVGDSAQRFLRRFTRSPATGALAGAATTAVVQSSSVTTVTAVGLASAGLLSFGEALGLVFGANVGTTVTGWMVAIVGFKMDVGLLMPPLVLVGALLRILGSGRVATVGLALAGFGLVFLGVETLQTGMKGMAGVLTPDRFPADTFAGRLLLVGIGTGITLVTQSSSAGVAMALTALAAGSIGFGQAAALVIGMDVGTTVSAALATVGASLPGKRTGWAHVFYNVLTACGAILLLPLYAAALARWLPDTLAQDPELALVGFHTLYNAVGVMLVLPFAQRFARLIERLVPASPAPFTHRLERSLLSEPDLALRAVAPTLEDLERHVVTILREQLEGESRAASSHETIGLVQIALAELQHYLGSVETTRRSAEAEARYVAALHVVDQLRRLLDRLEQTERVETIREDPALRDVAAAVAASLPAFAGDETGVGALAEDLSSRRAAFREETLRQTSGDASLVPEAIRRLDAYRWLERVTHHCWRATHHLGQLASEAPTGLAVEPPEPE